MLILVHQAKPGKRETEEAFRGGKNISEVKEPATITFLACVTAALSKRKIQRGRSVYRIFFPFFFLQYIYIYIIYWNLLDSCHTPLIDTNIMINVTILIRSILISNISLSLTMTSMLCQFFFPGRAVRTLEQQSISDSRKLIGV